MDARTGELYTAEQVAAMKATGAPGPTGPADPPKEKDLIWMEGGEEQIRMVSEAVKRDRRAQNKRARKARRKNRG